MKTEQLNTSEVLGDIDIYDVICSCSLLLLLMLLWMLLVQLLVMLKS